MIFLGVFDRANLEFSTNELALFQRALTRNPQDRATVHRRDHFTLLVIEDAAYRTSLNLQVSEPDGPIGLLSGRPYIDIADIKKDTEILLRAIAEDDHVVLGTARGSFCAVFFDAIAGTLRLCSDKVGVYPIYIAHVGSRIYFSSALRMLQALPGVCGAIDENGLFTQVAFGFPLGRRTSFTNVERMYGGEIVTFGMHVDSIVKRYWKWDSLPSQVMQSDQLAQRAHEIFLDAVRIRVEGAVGDLSFLSGGLDSRCIVAALREIDLPVWSLNFAPDGAQDNLFGRLVAKRLGAEHFELGLNSGSFPARQRKILDAWAESHPDEIESGVNRLRVWSGDGGSVGLGHVYLDDQFIKLLRTGSISDACSYFVNIRKHVVPIGMLHKQFQSRAQSAPVDEMRKEVSSFQCFDQGKSGLLFLLLNDQRHHLNEYFENLDLYRFEMVLPFFDARLLEFVVMSPLDDFLLHKLYIQWLKEFPPGVDEVPWQAYPGHVPCPLPTEQHGPLRDQWKDDWFNPVETKRRFREAVRDWTSVLSKKDFPDELLNKQKLHVAVWLTRYKIRDYSYVLDAAKKVVNCLTSA